MLLRQNVLGTGDFAASLCISLFFVDGHGIISNQSAENPAMESLKDENNHAISKNHDEPESYHKNPETEMIRNAQ